MAEFGIWTLPATMGAPRLAMEANFHPAHYDAVEREVKRQGRSEITMKDVAEIIKAIDEQDAAICESCGLFHSPPACA